MENMDIKPWNNDSFKIYDKNNDTIPYENITKLAAHAFLYCESSSKLFGHIPMNYAIMMQLRFDGKMGFPGGMVEKDEDISSALNRELHEELGLREEFYLAETNYFKSWVTPTFVDHFYVKKFTEDQFQMIEKGCLKAKDWGSESLGIIRVPVHSKSWGVKNKKEPFAEFLTQNFVSTSQSELIEAILSRGIIDLPSMLNLWKSCNQNVKKL